MKNPRLSQWLGVLIILAVLAAVLLPVLRRTVKQERTATCPSNLQTLSKALTLYVADNDEGYPPAYDSCYDANHVPQNRAWTYFLAPYVQPKIAGNAGWVIGNGWGMVDNAPTNNNAPAADNAPASADLGGAGPWHCPNDVDGSVLSYGVNAMVSGAFKSWGCGDGRDSSRELEWQNSLTTSQVHNPAQIAWGGDTNHYWNADKHKYTAVFPEWPRRTDLYLRRLTKPQLVHWYRSFLSKDFTDIKDQCPYPLAWGCRAPSYRHGRSANTPNISGTSTILFCDGHVSAVPFGKLAVENVFPDLTPKDADAPPIDASKYPDRMVDLGFAFHTGAINDEGLVAGGTGGQVFAFQGGKHMDLKGPKISGDAAAYAVNAAGEVAGNFTSSEMTGHGNVTNQYGFIWRQGKYQNIQFPDGYDGFLLRGYNRKGQGVGRAYRGSPAAFDATSRAFLWEKGKFYDLGVPPKCISSAAYAINEQGQVVGSAVTRDNHTHAFVWQHGVMRDLGTLPGGTLSTAYGINDSGQIVGDSNKGGEDVQRMHPVLWQNGMLIDLGLPASSKSCIAKAISNSGLVATLLTDLDGVPLDVGIWDKQHGMRVATSLCPPDSGWLLRDVYSINSEGQCVCRGYYGSDINRVGLLTPVGVYARQCAAKGVKWP